MSLVDVWESIWAQKDIQKQMDNPIQQQVSKILAEAVDWSDKTVLDLGCGMGINGHLALQHGAKQVTLIDTSSSALRKASYLNRGYGSSAFCVQASVFDYPLAEKHDIVLSVGLAEYFRDSLKTFFKVHFSLSRGCVVLISPVAGHYNDLRKAKARRFQGSFDPLVKDEVQEMCFSLGAAQVELQRFYPMYMVPMGPKWLRSLLGPLKPVLNKALTPFENHIGGLLLLIATLK